MRWLVIALCVAVVALPGGLAATTTAAPPATGTAPPDLPQSYVFGSGKLSPLRPHVTYQASQFPIALKLTPPDASWGAAQWKANLFAPDEIASRHLKCSTTPAVCKPPYYGWVAIGPHGTYAGPPPGLIVALAGYSHVPSVATTAANLRRGKDLELKPEHPVQLAGFSGLQFEGQTAAGKHFFIPFTPPSHGAAGGGAADLIEMHGPGHPFRFDVLNVRGHTVVVLVGSLVLSPDAFLPFRRKADDLLQSLTFPG